MRDVLDAQESPREGSVSWDKAEERLGEASHLVVSQTLFLDRQVIWLAGVSRYSGRKEVIHDTSCKICRVEQDMKATDQEGVRSGGNRQ